MKLTGSQLEAIIATENKIVVVACPGSGKTTVLTRRIKRLIEKKVSPKKIYALTFTNKAAEELKSRISNYHKGVAISTFHGFALRIIRDFGHDIGIPSDFTIYDEIDREEIIGEILVETGKRKKWSNKAVRVALKEWLQTGSLEDNADFKVILEEYLGRLKSYNAMDFDVLIQEAIKCLNLLPRASEFYRDRYEHFLIDEAQDTDVRQGEIISLINPQNLFYVGDIDQCIYEWRSAKPDIFISIAREPGVRLIHLEESHRVTVPVAEVANRVIEKNTVRFEKSIVTEKEGPKVNWLGFETLREESGFIWDYIDSLVMKGVEPKEIFVLARTNRWLNNLYHDYYIKDREFLLESISYNSEMWKADQVRKSVNTLKLLVNPNNAYIAKKSVFALNKNIQNLTTVSLVNETSLFHELESRDVKMERFFKEHSPESDVGSAVKDILTYITGILGHSHRYIRIFNDYIGEKWKKDRESTSIKSFLDWYAVKSLQDYVDFDSNKVKLMTVHAAKGLEADVVIIAGLDRNCFPSKRSDIEEERRLFYVAVTRSKKRLVLCHSLTEPSVFVEERHGILA